MLIICSLALLFTCRCSSSSTAEFVKIWRKQIQGVSEVVKYVDNGYRQLITFKSSIRNFILIVMISRLLGGLN